MSDRDELATTLSKVRHVRALHLEVPASIVTHVIDGIADAILAAGYRKPQQVTTVEELDALPDGSIILDARGLCREGLRTMGSGNVWRAMGPAQVLRSMEIALPATVLHVGGAE